ncbi:MAG TPA: tetratricopeptide repeat protein [Rhodanobacteraceae bacterium]|nr:tetratricopeptide repeat protein [Rhodanobacteraceae bacterium]
MTPDKPGFFEELKRRHVWRVAVAYAIVGWLVVQVATQVFPAFHMPDWTAQFVVILVMIGFPIALVLAWAFELTPEGIRRTEPAQSPDARTPRDTHAMARKLNAIIIGVLVLAVALLGWRLYMVPHASPPVAAASAPAAPSVPAKSIAVLPFQNLSSDKTNDYFVAGMQDLILTKLADIGDLKVISRTSTMQYGSHPENLKTVGEQLDVATVLEGSVQKQGNQVLVNVQLIDANTDSHIWAQSYTRTLDNVFGVEGEVAGQIATELNAKLSPAQSAQLAAAPTTNKAALDLYLRAEFLANKGSTNYDSSKFRPAIPLYRQAIEQDPGFALAYARLSWVESALAWFGGGGEDVKQLHAQARADAEQALKLAPDASATQLALGFSDYYGRGDYAGALKAFAAALALKPNDADALAAQGYVQRRQGRFDDSIASLQKAFALDPRNSELAYEVGATCMQDSRFPEAQDWFQRALAIDPDNRNAKTYYAYAIAYSTGDIPRALDAMQGDDPFLKLQRVLLLMYQRNFGEALALLGSVPDTPDNFPPALNGPKVEQQASLYRLMGDEARARPLFAQSLPVLRAQIKMLQGIGLATQWDQIGYAEIGSGQTAAGLDALAKSLEILADNPDQVYGPGLMLTAAQYYAQARRPDLAVPMLAKALAAPGIGTLYSPVLLWLDPMLDPIRHDPGFEALLNQYAKYKPAVTYDTAPAASASTAAAR